MENSTKSVPNPQPPKDATQTHNDTPNEKQASKNDTRPQADRPNGQGGTQDERLETLLSMAAAGLYLVPAWTPGQWDQYLDRNPEIKAKKSEKELIDGWKHPNVGGAWQDKGTRDPQQITDWHRQNPDGNWAVPTGRRYNTIMLDEDHQHGGKESLEKLVVHYGGLPDTWTERTPHLGSHRYYRYPDDYPPDKILHGSQGEIAPGIDIRAHNGCSICAPSHGREGDYQITSRGDIPVIPPWLLFLAEQAQAKSDGANGKAAGTGREGPHRQGGTEGDGHRCGESENHACSTASANCARTTSPRKPSCKYC